MRALLEAVLGLQLRAVMTCSQKVDPGEKREREKKIEVYWKEHWARNQRLWFLVPDLPLTNCVILGKSLHNPESVSSGMIILALPMSE